MSIKQRLLLCAALLRVSLLPCHPLHDCCGVIHRDGEDRGRVNQSGGGRPCWRPASPCKYPCWVLICMITRHPRFISHLKRTWGWLQEKWAKAHTHTHTHTVHHADHLTLFADGEDGDIHVLAFLFFENAEIFQALVSLGATLSISIRAEHVKPCLSLICLYNLTAGQA